MNSIPTSRDKPLFTPGPLSTSLSVKQAMLRDLGSRDEEFVAIVREIRSKLLELAGVSDGSYEAIPLQGSGTFSVEAVLSSTVPRGGKVLVLENGAYGKRMTRICEVLGIDTTVLVWHENETPDPNSVENALAADASITHVAVVHCESTTGIVNPVRGIGEVVRRFEKIYFVDAMSSFGAFPIQLAEWKIDYLVSSANKCIEGVPGFGYVLARRDHFLGTEGWARSLSMDLYDQWKALENGGRFRFTPPTHAMLAFRQALHELEEEGGVSARMKRYRNNHRVLVEGMREMGFREYLPKELQGWIITAFLHPDDPKFDFKVFYDKLSERGFLIYQGKLTDAECFRIGSIGRIFESDVRALLAAIKDTVAEMGFKLP